MTPDGEVEDLKLNDTVYLINNLPQMLYEKITKWYTDNDFGVKMKHEVKCRHCDWSEESDLPLDNFFF